MIYNTTIDHQVLLFLSSLVLYTHIHIVVTMQLQLLLLTNCSLMSKRTESSSGMLSVEAPAPPGELLGAPLCEVLTGDLGRYMSSTEYLTDPGTTSVIETFL